MSQSTNTVKLHRVLRGTPDRIYRAFIDPDAMAKFFYDMGKADAIDDSVRQSKNIDMSVRNAPQNIDKGGFKVTALDSDHGNRLKIKSLKN